MNMLVDIFIFLFQLNNNKKYSKKQNKKIYEK